MAKRQIGSVRLTLHSKISGRVGIIERRDYVACTRSPFCSYMWLLYLKYIDRKPAYCTIYSQYSGVTDSKREDRQDHVSVALCISIFAQRAEINDNPVASQNAQPIVAMQEVYWGRGWIYKGGYNCLSICSRIKPIWLYDTIWRLRKF